MLICYLEHEPAAEQIVFGISHHMHHSKKWTASEHWKPRVKPEVTSLTTFCCLPACKTNPPDIILQVHCHCILGLARPELIVAGFL